MTGSMRAAVYRGVETVQVETVEIPTLGPGEALVRVGACGVCGTDLKKIHYGLVPPPRIFGHETAGTIVALGAGVSDLQVGDRVVGLISIGDVVKWRVQEYENEQEALRTYIKTA